MSSIDFRKLRIKIGYREDQPKNRIADILSASGRSTLRTLLNESFGDVIRAVRSGGQDVRDPFLKIEELVQSFLQSVTVKREITD
jgi:hypothetical protein